MKNDSQVGAVKRVILAEWPEDKSQVPIGAEPYFQIKYELNVQDGIRFQDQRAVVLPYYIRMSRKNNICFTLGH